MKSMKLTKEAKKMGITKGICGGDKEAAKRMLKLVIKEMKKDAAEKK